jgi:hypothetical protein
MSAPKGFIEFGGQYFAVDKIAHVYQDDYGYTCVATATSFGRSLSPSVAQVMALIAEAQV